MPGTARPTTTPTRSAPAPTYLVKEGDEGFTIEVKATATNDNGVTASATSTATAAVLDAAPTVTTPTITGTAQEGQTLTASATAGQSDNPVTYAWYSSADNYTNPIGSGADLPGQGRRRELHDRGQGDRHQRQRRHGERDQRGDQRRCIDAAPTVTTPMITGTAQEGQTLTASATAGQSDNPVTYAWYSSADSYANRDRHRRDLSGQGRRRELHDRGQGDRHQRATASRASATSAATGAVLDAAPTVTTPTITGTAQEGQTLTASATAGQSDNPVTYAWYSSADNYTNPIGSGATYLGQGRRRELHDRGQGDRHQRQRRDGERHQRGDRGGASTRRRPSPPRRSPARRRKARR